MVDEYWDGRHFGYTRLEGTDVGYNCHGYSFEREYCWIADPSPIMADEDEVAYGTDAELIGSLGDTAFVTVVMAGVPWPVFACVKTVKQKSCESGIYTMTGFPPWYLGLPPWGSMGKKK